MMEDFQYASLDVHLFVKHTDRFAFYRGFRFRVRDIADNCQ